MVVVTPLWPNLGEIPGSCRPTSSAVPLAWRWAVVTRPRSPARGADARHARCCSSTRRTIRPGGRSRARSERSSSRCRRLASWLVADDVCRRLYREGFCRRRLRCSRSRRSRGARREHQQLRQVVAHDGMAPSEADLVAAALLMPDLGGLIGVQRVVAPRVRAARGVVAIAGGNEPTVVHTRRQFRRAPDFIDALAALRTSGWHNRRLPCMHSSASTAGDSLAFTKRLVREARLGACAGACLPVPGEGCVRWLAPPPTSRSSRTVWRAPRARVNDTVMRWLAVAAWAGFRAPRHFQKRNLISDRLATSGRPRPHRSPSSVARTTKGVIGRAAGCADAVADERRSSA